MGRVARWEQVIIVPDDYWVSSHKIKSYIKKEKNAKKFKRNKEF